MGSEMCIRDRIIGVAVAIIAAVVIISVIAAAVSQKDINDED